MTTAPSPPPAQAPEARKLLALAAVIVVTVGLLFWLCRQTTVIEQKCVVPAGKSFVWQCAAPRAKLSVSSPLPAGLKWSPPLGELRWTPTPAQVGEYQVRVCASRGLTQVNFELRLRVKGANLPPELAVEGALAVFKRDPLRLVLRVTDPDDDPVTVKLGQAPLGLELRRQAEGQYEVTWTPQQTDLGKQPLTLILSDGRTTVTRPLVLAVKDRNTPPTIVSEPPRFAKRGEPYRYPVKAEDEDDPQLTFVLLAAPPGMAIDATRGPIAWTPGDDDPPRVHVALRVSDGRGGAAEQAFDVRLTSLTKLGAFADRVQFAAPLDDDYLCGVTQAQLLTFRRDDLAAPVATRVTTCRLPRTFVLHQGYVYLCENYGTLGVYDVRDPRRIVLVSRTKLGVQDYTTMDRVADTLFVPDCQHSKLLAFSVQDPAKLEPLGSLDLGDQVWPSAVRIVNGVAYVRGYKSLIVASVQDPRAMRLRGSVGIESHMMLCALGVQPPYAYIHTAGQLRIIDVRDPAKILAVKAVDCQNGLWFYAAPRPYGFLIFGENGGYAIHLDDPLNPQTRPALPPDRRGDLLPGPDHDLSVTADGQVLGPDAAARPPRAGLRHQGRPYYVVTAGDYLYAIGQQLGVYDLKDPVHPRLVALTGCSYTPRSGAVCHDGYLFTPQAIVDVRQPAQPRRLGNLSNGTGIAVREDVAFVANEQTIEVWNVRDPAAPRRLRALPQPAQVAKVAVRGDVLFAGLGRDAQAMIIAYRMTADQQLQELGRLPLDLPRAMILDLDVNGDRLYVAANDAGVLAVDIRDPAAMRLHAKFDTSQFSEGVRGANGLALVADGSGGVLVVDLREGGREKVLSELGTADWTMSLAVHSPYIYTTEGQAGVGVFRADLLAGEGPGP